MNEKLSTQDKNAINDLLRFKKKMTNGEAREVLEVLIENCKACTCYDCQRGFGSCGRCRRCQDGDCEILTIDCAWKVVDIDAGQTVIQSSEHYTNQEAQSERA